MTSRGSSRAATPDEDVESAVASVEADVVVYGHTHVQFDRRLPSGKRVVNPGSVGLPYDHAVGAFWALLGPDVEMRCTWYDAESALKSFAATEFRDPAPTGGLFDGIFGRSLRGEIPPAEATVLFERRLSGWGENLGFIRLQLKMLPGNESSARVASKAGCTEEGVLRALVNQRGTIRDASLWSRVNG